MKFVFAGAILISFQIAMLFGNGRGSIKGTLLNSETKQPLIGANVVLLNSSIGAATDVDGNYEIREVESGIYSIKFSYIGYEAKISTDIIVRPDRITFVNVELKSSGFETDSIIVSSGYFSENEIQPISVTNFSYEEIRRAPGSAGDVSRIFYGLPSVAKVNDQSNSLIVRGGNPMENAFYIDNIEIPNINHFPSQGSSGGPIGMLNVDFINDVNFYTGGFSSGYGDKLSSIMEIYLREGNREEIDGQLDLNFSGFGGVLEGPLGNSGSWLVSARRSYLDVLIKAFDAGTSIAPVYSDYQWKFVYDLNANNKLSFIGLWGIDHSESDQKTAVENDITAYGKQNYFVNTTGLNLLSIWSKSGYSNTSVSYTSTKFEETYFRTGPGNLILDNNSIERNLKLRNVNHWQAGKNSFFEFGGDLKWIFDDYSNHYGKVSLSNGVIIPESNLKRKVNEVKGGVFTGLSFNPFDALTANFGIRADYFSFNEKITFSPRFSFSYQISEKTSLTGATGIFRQNLPLILLSQQKGNENLKDPMAIHYVIGIDHLLTNSTKLKVELYQKQYSNFPVDPSQPEIFIVDENLTGDNFYKFHNQLFSSGKAVTEGVEVTLQKKLAENFYGLAGISFFKTKYKTSTGWKNRSSDNRLIINVEGGYKPDNLWEFSARWIYAGGTPFTPFDISASETAKTGITDETNINGKRYPDYHSLNIRFDKRFLFEKSNIVVYLSIWNTYNRKNIATYYWNETENKQDEIYQWMLLPIFGVEYEF